jgi:hypothetical protein
MKSIKAITLVMAGVVGGSGGTLAFTADAAPGDAIYETAPASECVTAPQAACFADCAIAAGIWDGARNALVRATAMRDRSCSSGFKAIARGYKSAPLADVPLGSTVHGVVVEE